MEYLIRPCQQDDLPILISLCQKHADYEKANYDLYGKFDLLKDALFSAEPKLLCLVVAVDHGLAGYASYTFDFSTWRAAMFLHLDCLYLEAEYRGFGIGEVIIDTLKEVARQNGCVEMQWQTPSFNHGAINFYHRIGAVGKEKIRFSLSLQEN